MALKKNPLVGEALQSAEDGLDPHDSLTAEEALARVLWLLRCGTSVQEGYDTAPGIIQLTQWAHSEKGSDECLSLRTWLEDKRLLSRWA